MIRESVCKINLGLNIVGRRADGYHNIETVMYPVCGLSDLIEIVPAKEFAFSQSGIYIDCDTERNLCVRALRLMQERFGIGAAALHIHKRIPTGAGLGGGSANGTTVLKMCNEIWRLALSDDKLTELAAELGSDTPFFVRNIPQFARGRGEILSDFPLSLAGYWLLMIKPDVGVSTKEAYEGVTPKTPEIPILQILQQPPANWRDRLANDFESSVFAKLPLLAQIKEQMYVSGAHYAAMSGSGSTIFGLFASEPTIASQYFYHKELLR